MRRVRMTKDEIDLEILDVAAGLLASHGIKGMSMQALAAATGYSKAAMFARFENKELLIARVIDRCITLGREALTAVDAMDEGPERDLRAVETLAQIGLAHPGFMTLVIAAVTTIHDETLATMVLPLGDALFQMFGLPTPPAPMDVERGLAVSATLGGLSILVLNYPAFADEATARARIAQIASAPLRVPVPAP